MRKVIKRILLGVGSVIVLVLLLLLLAPLFLSGSLKSLVEKQVNAQIKGEMTINGDANFSLLRHFPDASVSFQDILLISNNTKDTLLATDQLSFLFNTMDMLRGEYNIHKVALGHTTLNIHTNEAGERNYDIFIMDTTATADDGRELSMNVKEFTFSAIELNYHNVPQQQDMQMNLANGLVSLDYGNSNADILLEADVLPGPVKFGTADYELPGKIHLAGGLQVDEENAVYRLSNTRITVEGDTYELEGLLEEKPYGWWIDVMAKGNQVSLESLWTLAAQNGVVRDWEVDSKGDLNFSATVKGAMGSGRNPAIEATMQLSNGEIASSVIDGDMKKVSLSGYYTNGEQRSLRTSRFDLREWKGEMNGHPFEISGKVTNFQDPAIEAIVDGTFEGEAVRELAASFGVHDLEGQVHFAGVNLQSDLASTHSIRGDITISDMAFDWKDQPFAARQGQLNFHDHQLSLSATEWQAGASDFTMDGTVSQWQSLFTTKPAKQPSVNLSVSSTFQDWDELLRIFNTPAAEADSTAAPTSEPDYVAYLRQIRGDVAYSCSKFSAGSFYAEDLVANARLRSYLITLDTSHMTTSDGELVMKGTGRYLNDHLVFQSDLRGQGINIKKLFASFDNFWQDYLVDENLSGQVSGTVDGILAFDQQLNLITEDLDIKGELTVVDGELTDFEPLHQLSAFVKMDELEDIKFSTLKNVVLVKGDRVILPVMAIKSTALNLWLSGEYFYDETIDYQFKIDLLDVMARKFSLSKTSLRHAERKGDGLVNLYVSMAGPVDDPHIETNKDLVQNRFYEMNLYKNEDFINFGELEQRSPTKKTVRPKNYGNNDNNGNLEFIDEW